MLWHRAAVGKRDDRWGSSCGWRQQPGALRLVPLQSSEGIGNTARMLDDEALVPIQREMKDVLGQFLYAAFPAFETRSKGRASTKELARASASQAPHERGHVSVAISCRLGDRVKRIRIVHPGLGSWGRMRHRLWPGRRFHVHRPVNVICLGAGKKTHPRGNHCEENQSGFHG